ncbi:MAG: M48 family metallopeptidase [Prevotellaceae bacterium]|nr:M48 family metallopeptidase [Prevotellaceae bacterium]
MQYVGLQTQINRNNRLSILLLIAFPCIILAMVWVFLAIINYLGGGYYNQNGEYVHELDTMIVNYHFMQALPWIIGGVGIWFIIAYFANTSMIQSATGAQPLARKDNPRVYNIVENLCMSCGMDMPKINIINDPQLNAFASGINTKTYTVTVTTGLLQLLNDDELAGVIGHELTHIRNHDTRLLITSIIFVGIISTVMSLIMQMLYNSMFFGGMYSSRRNDKEGDNHVSMIVVMFVGVICCAIAYIFTLLTRFAISRKREYMADAGGAELCGSPLALASALKKISNDPGLQGIHRDDVAQMFIIHPQSLTSGVMGFINNMFSTHPDTRKRIAILEQF